MSTDNKLISDNLDEISQAIAQARAQRSPTRIGMRAAAADLQTRF